MADEARQSASPLVIDVHTHIIRGHFPPWEPDKSLSPEQMIDHLNRYGIDRAVLLALEAPDSFGELCLTDEVLADAARYPERLIPFCHADPRRLNYGHKPSDLARRLEAMKAAGARGFGEHKVGLPIDHEWSCELYAICADLGFPVLLHLDFTLNSDSNGQPGLERVLRRFPETIFIGHGPTFWGEISADYDRATAVGYPTGKVARGGSTDRLLADYPNLYADLSAMSAYNALTRDPEFGADFLDRAWPKLLFGTDYLRPFQDLPIVEFMKTHPFPEAARRAIMGETAARLLGITTGQRR